MSINRNNLRARHATLYLIVVTCLASALCQHGAFAQVDGERTDDDPADAKASSAGSTSALPATVTEPSPTSESESPSHSTNTLPTNVAEISSTLEIDELCRHHNRSPICGQLATPEYPH